MTNRAVLAIAAGAVGGALGLLMADTVWALTASLPTPMRYLAGAVFAVAAGLWTGDAALYLEACSSG